MRKQRILSTMMTITASVLVLTACGSSVETLSDVGTNGMAKGMTSEAAWSTDAAMSTAKSYSEERADYDTTYSSEAEAVKSSMMIARNASLTVDVGNLEDFNTNLEKSVEELGGYFTNSNIENYSSEWSSDRYAYYTFKIPADKLDSFLNKLDSAEQQKRLMEGRVEYSEVNLTAHEERNVVHPVRKISEVNCGEKFVGGMSAAVVVFMTILFAIVCMDSDF